MTISARAQIRAMSCSTRPLGWSSSSMSTSANSRTNGPLVTILISLRAKASNNARLAEPGRPTVADTQTMVSATTRKPLCDVFRPAPSATMLLHSLDGTGIRYLAPGLAKSAHKRAHFGSPILTDELIGKQPINCSTNEIGDALVGRSSQHLERAALLFVEIDLSPDAHCFLHGVYTPWRFYTKEFCRVNSDRAAPAR